MWHMPLQLSCGNTREIGTDIEKETRVLIILKKWENNRTEEIAQ